MVTLSDLLTIAKPIKATSLFNYLQNKQKGGMNNAKGNEFENYFTIYQIAQLWDKDESNTLFTSQEFCFIDDLVIRLHKNQIQHFQIKDIWSIAWKSGAHHLADDFFYQAELYRRSRTIAKLYMIVSKKTLATRLRNSKPKKLKKIVTVSHFPAANSINRLLSVSVIFRNAISKLCALSNPRTDKLETIAAQLLGQWDISNKANVTLGQLKDGCLTSSPHFFKGGANHISVKLDTLLKSVNGLTFTIVNGMLEWNFNNGTDSGILPYKIGSTEFNQFENDLMNFQIGVTFQTIEHLFI